mmetsp:Transcript_391/g.1175  ORF Transcript_391/g.1175 Transcript_391/m.1175 type:complete len:355 (-) Transcript_391:142-1206(-)
MRVLRQPRDVRAAVHHPHLHLEDDAVAAAARVAHGNLAAGGGGHESRLHTTRHAKGVLLVKVARQRHPRQAAVHLGGHGELARLDDAGVDCVQRRRVAVGRRASVDEAQRAALVSSDLLLSAAERHKLAAEELAAASVASAQDGVVLDKERARVQPPGNQLEPCHLGLLDGTQPLVDAVPLLLDLCEWDRPPPVPPFWELAVALCGPLLESQPRKPLPCGVDDEPPLDLAARRNAVVARHKLELRVRLLRVLRLHGRVHLWVGCSHLALQAAKENVEAAVRKLDCPRKLGVRVATALRARGGELLQRGKEQCGEQFARAPLLQMSRQRVHGGEPFRQDTGLLKLRGSAAHVQQS